MIVISFRLDVNRFGSMKGNKSFAKVNDKVVPIIFDPATYYGDREADIAMTYLFGGFGADFYKGYESEWPLPEVSLSVALFCGDESCLYCHEMCLVAVDAARLNRSPTHEL